MIRRLNAWRKVAQCYPCLWAVVYLLCAATFNALQHVGLSFASPAHGAQAGAVLDVLTLARVAVQVWATPFYTVTRITAALLAFVS